MTTTEILNIEEVSTSQSQKEVTISEGLNALAVASNDNLDVNIGNEGEGFILSEAPEFDFDRHIKFRVIDVSTTQPTSATLRVPRTRRLFIVENTAPYSVEVGTDGDPDGAPDEVFDGDTVTITPLTSCILYNDGENVIVVGKGDNNTTPPALIVAASSEVTDLIVAPGVAAVRAPQAGTISQVRGSVTRGSTLGLVEVNVLRNGVSIFTTPITLDLGERTSVTAATPPVLDPLQVAVTDDDEFVVDVISAGSGTRGLKITILFE